jgi:hypothetical protein
MMGYVMSFRYAPGRRADESTNLAPKFNIIIPLALLVLLTSNRLDCVLVLPDIGPKVLGPYFRFCLCRGVPTEHKNVQDAIC